MSYNRPAYELPEDDPDTVSLYISLIPEKKKKGKTDKQIMDLAKQEMIKYRVPPPNNLRKKVYGGRKRTRRYKKSLKKRKTKKRKSTKQKKTRKKQKGGKDKLFPSVEKDLQDSLKDSLNKSIEKLFMTKQENNYQLNLLDNDDYNDLVSLFKDGLEFRGKIVKPSPTYYYQDFTSLSNSPRYNIVELLFTQNIDFSDFLQYLANHPDFDLFNKIGNCRKMLSIASQYLNPTIEKLIEIGLCFTSSDEFSGGLLEGKTFVISGVFDSFTRAEIKSSVEKNGGHLSTSISSKTDYLLMGSGVGPMKLKKAESLNVAQITEIEYKTWIGSVN